MTTATQSSVVDAVTAVDSTFGTVFEQIDSWRAAIERHVGAHHGAVTVAELDEVVEALVVPGLSAANALIIGAGFVASPGFISDAEWHLAWWLGHANTFGVGSADPALAELLGVEPGHALFELSGVARDSRGTALELFESWVRSDLVSFASELWVPTG